METGLNGQATRTSPIPIYFLEHKKVKEVNIDMKSHDDKQTGLKSAEPENSATIASILGGAETATFTLESATSASASANGNGASLQDQHQQQQREEEEASTTKLLLVLSYGFDPDLAHQAVNAIDDKSDVTAAYNWILDNSNTMDTGGPVVPKMDCPHISEGIPCIKDLISRIKQKNIFEGGRQIRCTYFQDEEKKEDNTTSGTTVRSKKGKSKCNTVLDTETGNIMCPDNEGENWMCLNCCSIRCSRYVNGHGLSHFEENNGHCLAVSLADLSVWCYKCERYILSDSLKPILKLLEEQKFKEDTNNSQS